jgi:hypothetical protein
MGRLLLIAPQSITSPPLVKGKMIEVKLEK